MIIILKLKKKNSNDNYSKNSNNGKNDAWSWEVWLTAITGLKWHYFNQSDCNREKSLRYACCHGSKISGSLNRKRNIYYDFSVHDYTQGQIGRPYFSSILQQCKWPALSVKAVEMKGCCYHGNLTSHSSFLSPQCMLNRKKTPLKRFNSSPYNQSSKQFRSVSTNHPSFEENITVSMADLFVKLNLCMRSRYSWHEI